MKVLSPMLRRAGALMLVFAAVLSACTVVVEDDDRRPIRPGPLCTREYDPVCARRGGDRQTFANACLADEAGYRIVRRGECRRDDGGGGGNDGPRVCTAQYDPVCARRGGTQQTFANACTAERAGYRVIRGGECREPDNATDRYCTREYAPVCARSGSQIRTFPNSCEARVSGFRIIADGPC